jgi:hypothetical protein
MTFWVANSIFGFPSENTAHALDIKNQVVYNKNILLFNKYNINNINIKYISIKLYNNNINNKVNNKKKVKLSSSLSFKEKVEIIMYSIKQVESHGRYNAKSKWSSACGAYQYMPLTWDNYDGFKTACLAPEWVQDARMRHEVIARWNNYHNWDKVIAGHYLPAYAGHPSKWNIHFFKGQPTIRQYVQNVQNTMNNVMVSLATA